MIIESNVCTFTPERRNLITGRGLCRMPAAPAEDNAEAPLSIGDFTFVLTVLPDDRGLGG